MNHSKNKGLIYRYSIVTSAERWDRGPCGDCLEYACFRLVVAHGDPLLGRSCVGSAPTRSGICILIPKVQTDGQITCELGNNVTEAARGQRLEVAFVAKYAQSPRAGSTNVAVNITLIL